MPKGLGFPDSYEVVPLSVLNQFMNPLQNLPVGRQPVLIVFPPLFGEYELHASRLMPLCFPFPDSSDLMDSNNRLAFAGDLSK